MSNCVGSSGLGLPASAVALLSRHTRRREVIALLSGVASWPFDARAQQSGSTRRIGVLMGYIESHPVGQSFVAAFREELQKLGWVEGRNIQIHTRWTAGDDVGARQRSAKELVAQQPDLILAHNTPVTAALLRETRTIPIVFATVSDPVGSGFVASMPRPGGNATGFTNIEASTAGKWLELLKEIAPHVSRAAFLFNPATASYADYLSAFKSSALSFAIEAIAAPVHSTSELEPVFSALARDKWRSGRDDGYIPDQPSRADHIAGCPLPYSRGLSLPSVHGSRRPAVLWKRHARQFSARGCLC